MRQSSVLVVLCLIVLLTLSACGPRDRDAADTAGGTTTVTPCESNLCAETPRLFEGDLQPFVVDGAGVEVGVGSPIPVDVVVGTTWPDLCAQLERIELDVQGRTINITLLASPAAPDCRLDQTGGAAARIVVPLNGLALEPGDYTVIVNGFETTFTWPAP
jgi:hypothetical protein